MQRSNHLLVCFCFFLCCIVTFEHADALRRIKRGSIATTGGSMPAKDLGHELHANASHKEDNSNKATIASVEEKMTAKSANVKHLQSRTKGEYIAENGTLMRPISSVSFTTPKDDVDKTSPHATSPTTRSAHAHLQYTNTADIKPSYVAPLESPVAAHKQGAPLDSSAKELHKSSPFISWFDPLRSGWFDDAQLERVFGGDGPDVLIIDNNNMQPVAGERAALNFRPPKFHSVAHSQKPLVDSGKHSDNNKNNANDNSEQQRNNRNEHNNGHNNSDNNGNNDKNNSHHNSNNNNNNNGIDTRINDRGQNNATPVNPASNRNTNNNNGNNNNNNDNNNKVDNDNDNNNRIRTNDDTNNHNNNAAGHPGTHAPSANHHPATCAAGGNVISANNNNNNNFGSHAANNYGGQRQQLQRHTFSMPPLLTLAGSAKVDQRANEQRLQDAGAPVLQQHEKLEHQQQQQLLQQSHFGGKVLPVDSMLKFANMLLYKMDGAPIHAQRAEVSINSNPTSVVSVGGPNVENSDDLDTIDFFYNNLEPQVAPVLRFPQPMSIGGGSGTTTLLAGGPGSLSPHPFLLPPFNINAAPPPFNLLESALDLLLGGGEDDGDDQIELRCPIHHEPKKKNAEAAAGGAGNSSAEAAGEGKDEDGKGDMIQVCSCRIFKKKKSA